MIIGAELGRHGGWFYGMLGGMAFGVWISSNWRINKLRKQVVELTRRLDDLAVAAPEQEKVKPDVKESVQAPAATKAAPAPATITEAMADAISEAEKTSQPTATETEDIEVAPDEPEKPPQQEVPIKQQESEQKPLPIDIATSWLKEFFTTGNIMVKVGVTVLFFGVAFLVKYAAERNILPIEFRLAGVALGGIVMLVIGWRLREKKTAYGLIMQGGALGVLYLTVFSALRLYHLIPPTLAFGVLFVFAAFSAALAVLQNSRALAVLGVSGGFMAPILTSTGSGNYVALFSYYLVLNLGIFGIAWFRSWRLLNLVGFVFTFVVATAWGVKYYTPENFSSTEPFLIAFYLLYVAISVLFAFRQPVQLKGYVDSTLVFGVPLVGFGLQAGMVYRMEYGLAISSICLSAFYIGLASILWRRMNPDSRLICEAFVALGVIFATLAIPFALDARWTAGTWALEGAAAVWVGARQSRLLPRALGYLLQFAGGLSFLSSVTSSHGSGIFIFNGQYIGALIIALSGIFIAWRLMAPIDASKSKAIGKHPLTSTELTLSTPFLVWGLIWWYASGIHEITDKMVTVHEPLIIMLFIAQSSLLAQVMKTKLDWKQMQIPALSLMPVMYLLFPYVLFINDHPFGDWVTLGWLPAFIVQYWMLRQYDEQMSGFIKWLHILGFWLLVIILTVEIAWHVDSYVSGSDTWWLMVTGVLPSIVMIWMYRYGEMIAWPVRMHRKTYQVTALLPMAMYTWLWFIVMNLRHDGNAYPLSYLPILNPLDLVLGMQLIILVYWQKFAIDIEDWGESRWRFETSQLFLAMSFFLWLNTMWLRLAHHAWGIDFDLSDMTQSRLVQAGISVLWGVTGLLSMIMAARRSTRKLWMAGAVVMGAVVAKLFMFDLANTGTVERIVSFMTVGILLLVVGYFAPVPPAEAKEENK